MRVEELVIKLEEKELVNISFEIEHSLALVGQSGSGKSLTLKALLGMLPKQMQHKIEIESEFTLKRGETLGFVPQNPFTALSPLTKIRQQFFVKISQIEKLFEQVGLKKEFLDAYPPELSGGQLQRVVLAMALERDPKLLMLDEPTTALDPKNKEHIIKLLQELQEQLGFKILFVTHDIASAEALCKEIAVLKEGQIIENGTMQNIIQSPQENYTQTLIEASFAHRKFRE